MSEKSAWALYEAPDVSLIIVEEEKSILSGQEQNGGIDYLDEDEYKW